MAWLQGMTGRGQHPKELKGGRAELAWRDSSPAPIAGRAPLVRLALANLGYAQASYLGLLIILPGQATLIEGRGHRTLLLAAAAVAGAIVALPAGIAAGRFSDRRLRLTGFRRPVLVLAAALGAVLLVAVPFGRSVPAFLLAWCGAQIGSNGVFVLITAALVDWFTIGQRARASAFAAAGQVTGALIASGLAFTLGGHLVVIAAVSGTLLLAASLPAAFSRQPASARPDAAPLAEEPHIAPSRSQYRDARLAWTVRAVVTFANTLVFTFANYYVSDALQLPDPQRFVGLVAGVTAVLVLAGALTSGWASDRSQRRRRFVITAVIVMSAGELLLAAWQTVAGVIVACALFGYGYGVYLSVDQALTADVLPDPRVYGRDIGFMNAAISAPQIAAPALAAALLGAFASYGLLFAAGALITATGAVFVVPIRRVR
jgi:MFS family permease